MNLQKLEGSSPFEITKLSHVNYYYTDFPKTIRFFVTVLGFKPSDIINSKSPHPLSKVLGNYPLCFLRLNTDHHSSALFPDLLRIRDKRKDTAIQQFSWEVQSYNQVKRGVDFLKQNGIEIDFIGRRMPASNYNLYFWDPDGYRIEMTWGMEQVGWTGATKPIQFWNELRMYDALPDGPVLPDEVEARRVTPTIPRGDKWKHSLDEYDVAKWDDTGKKYDVDGAQLPRPFRIFRPAYLGLVVRDLDFSVGFYTRILGFKLKQYLDVNGNTKNDTKKNGEVALLSHSEETYSLCLYSLDAKEKLGLKSPGMLVHAAFEVETLSQLEDSIPFLRDMGVEVIASGRVNPTGDYVVDTKTPDGWIVRLVYRNKGQEPIGGPIGTLWSPAGGQGLTG